MSILQKIISSTYNLRLDLLKLLGSEKGVETNLLHQQPPKDFYSLHATLIDGRAFYFSHLKNKKVLIVNTASLCGYTQQYRELQNLFEAEENLEVLAFPSSDFREQEPGKNEEIAAFCEKEFGITFKLFEKSHVTGAQKNEVFIWLTMQSENGWNTNEPSWNFFKYFIDEEGILQAISGPTVRPQHLLAISQKQEENL